MPDFKPDQAGLQFDEQSTVAKAAQADYNPISVIGSLFGNHRVVDPVMPVDEEKLNAALQSVAGGSGSMTEGTIKFESGKAVAVYGKAGKGIDPAKSAQAVVEAYRNQVGTGATDPVAVVTTTKQPTISNAEVASRIVDAWRDPAKRRIITDLTTKAIALAKGPIKAGPLFKRIDAALHPVEARVTASAWSQGACDLLATDGTCIAKLTRDETGWSIGGSDLASLDRATLTAALDVLKG